MLSARVLVHAISAVIGAQLPRQLGVQICSFGRLCFDVWFLFFS
jgi:hypothetical protein